MHRRRRCRSVFRRMVTLNGAIRFAVFGDEGGLRLSDDLDDAVRRVRLVNVRFETSMAVFTMNQ